MDHPYWEPLRRGPRITSIPVSTSTAPRTFVPVLTICLYIEWADYTTEQVATGSYKTSEVGTKQLTAPAKAGDKITVSRPTLVAMSRDRVP